MTNDLTPSNAQPPVALESTVITHGLPYPQNLTLANDMEAAVRAHGAEPRTIGIVQGELIAGLSSEQLAYLASAAQAPEQHNLHKVSRRDLPIAVARRWNGGSMNLAGPTTCKRPSKLMAWGSVCPAISNWYSIGWGRKP